MTVVILGVGIIAVYRPLLTSVNALQYAENRIEANYLVNEQAWEILQTIRETKKFPAPVLREELIGSHTIYTVTFALSAFGFTENLMRAQAEISWHDMGQVKTIKREIYFSKPFDRKH